MNLARYVFEKHPKLKIFNALFGVTAAVAL